MQIGEFTEEILIPDPIEIPNSPAEIEAPIEEPVPVS